MRCDDNVDGGNGQGGARGVAGIRQEQGHEALLFASLFHLPMAAGGDERTNILIF
jgi:hypothetical protein